MTVLLERVINEETIILIQQIKKQMLNVYTFFWLVFVSDKKKIKKFFFIKQAVTNFLKKIDL